MSIERSLFYITTDVGAEADARQNALASRTLAVPESEADRFGIETFMHSYEPVAAYAWLREARNPMIKGRRALDIPFDPNAKRRGGGGGVWPAGRTQANKLRLLAVIGVTEGMEVEQARVRLRNLAQGIAQPIDLSDAETMLDLVPKTGTVSLALLAPAIPAEWERIASAIDSLSNDEQFTVASATFQSLSKFFKSINVAYNAILPIRRMCERLWGYYDFTSDQYNLGISSETIKGLLASYSPAPYIPGLWRVRGAANQQATWGQRAHSRSAGDVIFGKEREFNCMTIGCRSEEGATALVNVSQCNKPTGETHRIWFQINGSIGGNANWSPANIAEEMHGQDFIDYESVVSVDGDFHMLSQADPQWTAPYYQATSTVVKGSHPPSQCWKGRDRLWMVPPLEWYWRMYFAPQLEFGGRSFAEWVLAMPPSQFIRDCRRSNTQRNARLSLAYDAELTSHAPGDAAASSAAEGLRLEKANQARMDMVSEAGASVATAAAAIPVYGPVISLVVGAVTVASVALMSAIQNDIPLVKIDVLGQMQPSFGQFSIANTKVAFSATWDQMIGMPPNAQLSNPPTSANAKSRQVAARKKVAIVRVTPFLRVSPSNPPNVPLRQYDQIAGTPGQGTSTGSTGQGTTGTSGGVIALGVAVVALLGGGAYLVTARSRAKSNRRRHAARNRRRAH